MSIPIDSRGNPYYKAILPSREDIAKKLEGHRLNTEVSGIELYDIHKSIIDTLKATFGTALDNAIEKLLEGDC